MKSEFFSNSYCIFVMQEHSSYYKEEIERQDLIKKGIRIINAKFDPSLSCIVIPIHCNYNEIVKNLFEKRKENGLFWHQLGMGYEGKEWELV